MKNPFKPFTGESLIVALGLTFVSYMVIPFLLELIESGKEEGKGLFQLDQDRHERFLSEKGKLAR
ncbi:MAG: hypothetical protein ACOYVK_18980 [Bacillota bacterium]